MVRAERRPIFEGDVVKALVYYGQRDIRLEEVETPTPTERQVLIKVTDAGICQTQINEFMEGPAIINKEPHPLTGKAIPLIVGHEFGGIVTRVGAGVSADLVGRQVAVLPLLACGKCRYCRSGQENLCNTLAYYGLLGENGGFAEYAAVNRENVFPIENPNLLTFIEPVLVGIHAADQLGADLAGKKVLVLGAGALGLALAAVWQSHYGATVYLNDILPARQARAAAVGFPTLTKEAIPADFDIVADCAGNDPLSRQAALLEGFDYLRKGGTLLSIGSYFHPQALTPISLLLGEKRLLPAFAYNSRDVAQLGEVLASLELDWAALIATVPLADIVEQGYFRAEVDRDSFTRLVVKC